MLSGAIFEPAVGRPAKPRRYYSVLAVAWLYSLAWLALTLFLALGRLQTLAWYFQIGILFIIVLLAPPFDRLFRGYDRYKKEWEIAHTGNASLGINGDR